MKNTFRKLSANESLIMACLQTYRELLSLAPFLRIHSNSKEVSYLYWQNRYPNLKTTCHTKLEFFLWFELLLSLLLAKCLIYIVATLMDFALHVFVGIRCLLERGVTCLSKVFVWRNIRLFSWTDKIWFFLR